ncbi:MAG TPA: hypothetical protein EYN91_11910 [Candidatus Melainabacteria bacterium]|nr:hypothetical protein [Candidatus Melainabacteria bacterium]
MTNTVNKSQDSQSKQNENQSQQKNNNNDKEGVKPNKGEGFYPISDMQFDVITVIQEKCKALQAYDKYLLDAQPCEELTAVLEKIRSADKEHVEELKQFLGKC